MKQMRERLRERIERRAAREKSDIEIEQLINKRASKNLNWQTIHRI